MISEEIEIRQEDIIPYIYFVCSMSQSAMHGALSSKSDFIGGIFDRWINIIPESIIFNKYFLPKAKESIEKENNVRVFSDFYKYKPSIVGIAPDVLGIKVNEKVIPFVKYDDNKEKKNYWVAQPDCPQIEVKSFKKNQYMVSLRDQGYDDKFLVMVEMNLTSDYLIPFFNKEIFPNDILAQLEMPECFIVSNKDEQLNQTEEFEFAKEGLGSLKLLKVTKAKFFKERALKLNKGEKPKYLKDYSDKKRKIDWSKGKAISYYVTELDNGLFRFNVKWSNLFKNKSGKIDKSLKTLDLYIENKENILVIKTSASTATIHCLNRAKINQYIFEVDKQYILNFGTFGSIAGEEYFLNKWCLPFLESQESELIENLSQVIKNNV